MDTALASRPAGYRVVQRGGHPVLAGFGWTLEALCKDGHVAQNRQLVEAVVWGHLVSDPACLHLAAAGLVGDGRVGHGVQGCTLGQ